MRQSARVFAARANFRQQDGARASGPAGVPSRGPAFLPTFPAVWFQLRRFVGRTPSSALLASPRNPLVALLRSFSTLNLNVLLAAAIFLANALLNGPLFMTGEMPFRGSIESGYIGMARFISAHPNPWGWDPLQYCGLPTQFLYLPGMPYTSAVLMRLLPGTEAQTVYRLLAAALTCLGPVTLFLFALYFMRSRAWAVLTALAYTVFSPAYGLLPHLLKDLGKVLLPWRIMALVKYGEGPHTMGLALLPLALIAVWTAGVGRKFWQIFLAAVLLAAIVLTNWIAGLSLAFCGLLFLIATWRTGQLRLRPILAAGALAYLLAAFWLTPSFIHTVVFNWPVDSFGYHAHRAQKLLIVGMIAGVLLIRALFLRHPRHWYLCFVTLGAFVFGWIAVVFSEFGLDTIPESRRYAPEFEMFLLLALAAWLRLGWQSSNSTARLCAIAPGVLLLLMGAGQARTFLTQGWSKWKPVPRDQTIEYQAASWLARQNITGRVYASGGLRYRLDSWFDIPQTGGGWESGLENRQQLNLAFQIRATDRLQDALVQLKAMAVQYVVVHGPGSREYYRDFKFPATFASLPVVWHQEDDTIYALPHTSLAHVVFREELPKSFYAASVTKLANATDDQARPKITAVWQDQNDLRITGAVPSNGLVYVHMSAHEGWSATQDGHPVALSKDGLGFIVIEASPSLDTTIHLHFRGTTEQRLFAAISAIAWLAAILLLCGRRFRLPIAGTIP